MGRCVFKIAEDCLEMYNLLATTVDSIIASIEDDLVHLVDAHSCVAWSVAPWLKLEVM